MRELSVLLLLVANGCASASTTRVDTARAEGVPAAERKPESTPWAGGRVVESNDGSYRVVYKLEKEPLPRGEPFALDAWVFAADVQGEPLSGVSLAADGAMPQHGHGMNRVARVADLGGGHFRVEGLLFHMPGKWELYFDVTSGARTYRAQADIDLE